MKHKMFRAVPAALAAAFVMIGHSASHAQDTNAATNPTEALIWSQEQKIYADRGHGRLQYYIDHTSPAFLAWPVITDRPINNDGLKKERPAVAGGHEVIKGVITGFTQDGDTAIIYYINHRSVRANGAPDDETFANIHVWIKRGSNWVLLAGMSRLLPPAKTR